MPDATMPCSLGIELGSLWQNCKTGRVAEVVWFDEQKVYTETVVTASKYGGCAPPKPASASMSWRVFLGDWNLYYE